MKVRFLFISTLSLIAVRSFSQAPDSTWISLGNRNIDSSMVVYCHRQSESMRIHYHPATDREVVVDYTDSSGIDLRAFALYHTASSVNIQYLTDSIWFIYGTRTEYAFYPFILKSSDSGKTWKYVLHHELNSPDVRLVKRSFFMFDENNGIWIIGRGRNSIRYRITQDGGKTWRNQRIHYHWKRDENQYQERFTANFSKSGSVDIFTFRSVFSNGTLVAKTAPAHLYSDNKGKSFRRIRP